jgi:hypothetical protein
MAAAARELEAMIAGESRRAADGACSPTDFDANAALAAARRMLAGAALLNLSGWQSWRNAAWGSASSVVTQMPRSDAMRSVRASQASTASRTCAPCSVAVRAAHVDAAEAREELLRVAARDRKADALVGDAPDARRRRASVEAPLTYVYDNLAPWRGW